MCHTPVVCSVANFVQNAVGDSSPLLDSEVVSTLKYFKLTVSNIFSRAAHFVLLTLFCSFSF